MGLRSSLAKPFAAFVASKTKKWSLDPFRYQQQIMQEIVRSAQGTSFGKDHDFVAIRNYDDFKRRVPVRDYEDLKPYFDRLVKGEADVLWKGKPKYLAKTSGTTSGTKYIPITHESVSNHFNSARDASMSYIHETGRAAFLDGNLIFLSGSPELSVKAGIKTGRLSGIVNHEIPAIIRSNQRPSYAVNCIEDWEEKLERIVDETEAYPSNSARIVFPLIGSNEPIIN